MLTRHKLTIIGAVCAASLIPCGGVKAQDVSTLPQPRLVVGITVEGMSMDYIDMLRHCFTEKGFNRLVDSGVTFTDVDFGTPLDGVASNAIIHTGASPTINGIGSRNTFDIATHRSVPLMNSESPSAADENFSPAKLLSTTLSDEIQINGEGMGHVHSIAPDASMAIAAAGHAANSAYWINDVSGKWTTSTFFQERPMFLQYRNRMMPLSDRLDTLTWKPYHDIKTYPGLPSLRRSYPFRVSFPYGEVNRYLRYKESPMVNAEVTDVAIEYIRNLELGSHEGNDMLNISYTLQPFPYGNSADEKAETMDGYIRLDNDLARLFSAVEEGPGMNNTLFFIVGTPMSPRSRQEDEKWRIPTGEFSIKRAVSLLNLYLINKFGNGDWIAGFHNGYVYLNPSVVQDHNVDVHEVRNEAASFLRKMSGVAYAYTLDDILNRNVHDNADAVARNTRHDAVGDIMITVAPGWKITTGDDGVAQSPTVERTGVSTAPGFILWDGLEKQTINTVIDARSIAPTVASILRIRSPNGASLSPVRLKRAEKKDN